MPWISLDTAASSAVSGEIDPEVKKSTKDLVVDVEFQARAYFQGQMLLQKEEESRSMATIPHHGIAKVVEAATTHSAPTLSVSHPVNRDAGGLLNND